MNLRFANGSDAKAISEVIVESIKVNCFLDHSDELNIINSWCKNKTPEIVQGWIDNPNNITIVATEKNNQILGIGMNSKEGELLLLYVSPWHINKGIGKAILYQLEQEALKLGLTHFHLHSTETAHDFYSALGYLDCDKPIKHQDNRVSYPMHKCLKRIDGT